tara:strand:- start:100 stop:957 length:858 start_codon:yes stop_codon:yes gene_type:complete
MKNNSEKLLDHFKSSPKYTIKWDNYFEIYDSIFKKYENKKITIVEVGVGNGGSLFMWKSFFKDNARVIGVELNPDAKKLEENGFEIFIGDQSDPNFWKEFFNKVGKVDIFLDDGGHRNLQQITSLVESIDNINHDGMIVIEDTHTSYMKKKGFKNPSSYSFINFCNLLIESIHRRNPMVLKTNNKFSNKIHSLQFFDSITVLNISLKMPTESILLESDTDKRVYFTDYRHNGYFIKSMKFFDKLLGKVKENSILHKVIRKIFHRNIMFTIHEKSKLRNYFKEFKK